MKLGKDEMLKRLREIDEYEFEQFVADLWERQGWSTNVTKGSNDAGIDIVAKTDKPFPQKHLIQAKRYGDGNKVSSPEIQQYSSLRRQESDSDAVIIVTTSSFTDSAIESADLLNVKLIEGNMLYNLILEHNAEDIVKKYIDVSTDTTNTTLVGNADSSDENWAESIDKLQADNTEEDTVYDVLSRTKKEESSWPQNLIPVSDSEKIRNTLMRCLNEALENDVQGIIKWDAKEFEYAVLVIFTEQEGGQTGDRSGVDISIEIAKKDSIGGGVDLDVSSVSCLRDQFDYQIEAETSGPFSSVIASKFVFDDEYSILDILSVIEYIIEYITDQTIQDISYVSVLDPDQF